MNTLNDIISVFSPKLAAKRELHKFQYNSLKKFSNTGYSHGGASRSKKTMRGWDSSSASPYDDIGENLAVLRERSRDLTMNTPIGSAAISRNEINVIGSGLTLKSQLDYESLGLTKEEAKKWQENTESEFKLWADDKMDNTGLNTFYDMQGIMLKGWLTNGDSLALVKYDLTENLNPYRLRLHLLEADRLSTPNCYQSKNQFMKLATGGAIYNGVETDEKGKVTAYHFSSKYPNSKQNYESIKWNRVSAMNKASRLPNVLFVIKQDRAEQYRGVPLLAPVIEQIKQLSRYTDAEITAAIINSFFTAFITSDNPVNEIGIDSGFSENEEIQTDDERLNGYELGPGTINQLAPGENITFADPKHPNSGFDVFSSTMAKLIGSALNIPFEVLLMSFNSSYSASRAALLQAWQAFKMKREWFAKDFCQPVYEIWLYEAISTGRIKAPKYFEDYKYRKLWSGAQWIGPSAGQVDPVKEVTAAQKRVENGFSTREKEAYEMTGTDYNKNILILQDEEKKLQEVKGELSDD